VRATHRLRVAVAAGLAVLAFGAASAEPASLATAAVRRAGDGAAIGHEGVVEAVRHTVLAAQVSGSVVALNVKVGDTVRAGQVLLRLDARAAEQAAAAAAAQVQAARAAQEEATREFERQKLLFEQNYISRAALERAQARNQTTQAQVAAQLAGAGAARTQSGFYAVAAPYAGVVAEVPVVLGDMALPGRPLVALYDPSALRVTARVPERVAAQLRPGHALQVELPGSSTERVVPTRWQLLPTVDPASHTLELRLDLPADVKGLAPGMFARAWLPGAEADGRLFVPRQAVVRRAELDGVYVVGSDGRALLRQVRLGRPVGDDVEVLAGLAAGERVALDPQGAARSRLAGDPAGTAQAR
jgi:multidrug efflux system membrane fusion protein